MSHIEHKIKSKLSKKGFMPMQNGWPDFLIKDSDGNIFLLEAKSRSDHLGKAQKQMLQTLADLGFSVFIVCETAKTFNDNQREANIKVYEWKKDLKESTETLTQALSRFESGIINNALIECSGNIKEASNYLGIKHNQLTHKLKKYGINHQP